MAASKQHQLDAAHLVKINYSVYHRLTFKKPEDAILTLRTGQSNSAKADPVKSLLEKSHWKEDGLLLMGTRH